MSRETATLRLEELSIALQYAGRSTGHTGSNDGGAGESLCGVDFDVVCEFDYGPAVPAKLEGAMEDAEEGDPGNLDIFKITLAKATRFTAAPGIVMWMRRGFDLTKYVPVLQVMKMEEELSERKKGVD